MVPEHSQGARRGFSAVGWWRMRGGREESRDAVDGEEGVMVIDLPCCWVEEDKDTAIASSECMLPLVSLSAFAEWEPPEVSLTTGA